MIKRICLIIIFIFVIGFINFYPIIIGRISSTKDINDGINYDNKLNKIDMAKKYPSTEFVTMDEIIKMVGIDHEREKGFTGKGITVAILDSGTYPHQDLIFPKNKIIAFKDFINDYKNLYDDYGHGTMIAGIISGTGYLSDNTNKGIAPDSEIVSVKVLDNTGKASEDMLVKGIEWIIKNRKKYNIRIINLSIGLKVSDQINDQKLRIAAEKATKEGLLVVTSVGNVKNQEFAAYSPSDSSEVLSVGSIINTKQSIDFKYTIASFSNSFKIQSGFVKPDVVVPGHNILALEANTYYIPTSKVKITDYSNYYISNGTSMSSAIVSGIAAVLMEHYPQKSNKEIISLIKSYCVKINDEYTRQGEGYVYIKK